MLKFKAMEDKPKKKLYRKLKGRVCAGIFAGLGDYFGVDPVLLRVIYIILTIITAGLPSIIIYGLLILIIPPEPDGN